MRRKEITVQLDDRKVVVKKLAIGAYSELFLALQSIPKHLDSFQGIDNDKIIQALPEIISDATPDVVKIVAIATDLEDKYVESLGLAEITSLIEAALEVNDFTAIVNNVKKIMALGANKMSDKLPEPTLKKSEIGSTEQ